MGIPPANQPLLSRRTTESSEDSKPCHNPVTTARKPCLRAVFACFHTNTENIVHQPNTVCQLFSAICLSANRVFCRLGVCRRIPSSARERAIFSPGKDGEAGDVGFIVDGAGCSQVEKGPLEARATFPTEPTVASVLICLEPWATAKSGEAVELADFSLFDLMNKPEQV